ncbi:MAG: hypothetical protein GX750_06900 [Clostridia bacterium]|nr:hypothetical protein [Clostridia bacterium]
MRNFIEYMEKNYSPKVPKRAWLPQKKPVIKNGTRIIIVGGGISGSSLARELLILATKENIDLEINLVNSNTCNYCGGLITNLAQGTLEEIYQLSVPRELILREVKTCAYVTNEGSVEIDLRKKMIATLRTSKFGILGFDDSIKSRITEGLGPKAAAMLRVFEPTLVRKIFAPEAKEGKWKVRLSRLDPHNRPVELEGDVLVMASGFKSLNRPMMRDFEQQTGYSPPPLMEASVTEIYTDEAVTNKMNDQILIVDNIVPGAVIAVIPKSDYWVTVTSLGRRLTTSDVDLLFSAEAVKKYLDLPSASQYLRCKTICPAQVFTGPSRNFYGDGWVAIGDLTGYGRVLKDGYFASFWEAQLVAHTLFYHGAQASDFRRYYHRPLRKFLLDNRFGMWLFKINLRLGQFPWFRKLLLAVGQLEEERNPAGSFMHSATRALATGDLSYRLITLFYVLGFCKAFIRPRALLSLVRQGPGVS